MLRTGTREEIAQNRDGQIVLAALCETPSVAKQRKDKHKQA